MTVFSKVTHFEGFIGKIKKEDMLKIVDGYYRTGDVIDGTPISLRAKHTECEVLGHTFLVKAAYEVDFKGGYASGVGNHVVPARKAKYGFGIEVTKRDIDGPYNVYYTLSDGERASKRDRELADLVWEYVKQTDYFKQNVAKLLGGGTQNEKND